MLRECWEGNKDQPKKQRSDGTANQWAEPHYKHHVQPITAIRVDNYTGEAIGTQHYKTLITDKFSFLWTPDKKTVHSTIMEGVKGHHAGASGWPERTTFKPATKDHHLWTEAAVNISMATNCSHDQNLILHIYIHNTHSCCMMHEHHNEFSCESWKQ